MRPLHHLLLFILVCFSTTVIHAQKVGLVMSGGGASGFAHVGVLKALEENGIPIDYITGTSAGALVGALYSCGYSPEEIEAYILSSKFRLMSNGELERSQEFLLREDELNAGMLSFSFSRDSIFQKSLPTNFIRPELLDYEMMRLMGVPGAAYGNQFDSLFVPFRCVASDIVAKRSVVFREGYLNQAVRASMTFPFFVNPIRINGVLYFDGGLYNNFPADILNSEFKPDAIIGSNVSYNAPPPDEDDLISQLTNMLVSHSNFSIPIEKAVMIEPKTAMQTFEFSAVEKAIDEGYRSTIAKMDSISRLVDRRVTKEELTVRRKAFRSRVPDLVVSEINTADKFGLDESYVRRSILKNIRQKPLEEMRLERRYFRTYATPQIQYLYPTLTMRADSTYTMKLDVRRSKDFRLDVGGLVCSRAVNTGFFQLNYLRLGKVASDLHLNSYFGKFYGSGKVAIDIHFPSYFPISMSAYAVLNRWDYFRSFATFFEDVKPSFLVQYETYYGAQVRLPIFNNSKSTFDFRHCELEDSYYQTAEFTNKDTTDYTRFKGNVVSWTMEQNSLNRKQFASGGSLFMFRARLVDGHENSVSGSTSPEPYNIREHHRWINFSSEVRTFPFEFPLFKMGIHGLANLSSQSLFKNYTATILSMNAFEPLPDMQTYFLPEYRSPQYVGAGVNVIFTILHNFDLRFDGYIYQPFIQLIVNDNGTFGYSKLFKGETPVAAVSGIYHSPVGPVRLSFNYFPQQTNPLQFQLSYGYVIFNERATK